MAHRLSRRVHIGLAAAAALACSTLLVPSLAGATPNTTPQSPSVGSVQQQLSKLALQNTMLIEQFDQAQADVQAKQAAAAAAERVAAKARAAFAQASVLLGATATAQYEGGSFSSTGALLTSDSGQSYLDQLQTLQAMETHTAAVIDAVQAAQNRADSASKAARDLVAVATAKLDALSHQRAVLQKQIDNYTSMLASLSFNQRVAYQQAVTPSLNDAEAKALLARLASVPATNKAMIAVKFALAQVGKPYVYATAGPDTYDCSGLTMAAWRAAGVSLPHSSEEQFNMGTAVPLADIQPGDLLFYYGPPPGHVTIYVGGGLMVSAPEPGEDVKVVKVSDYANDYVGARRVG